MQKSAHEPQIRWLREFPRYLDPMYNPLLHTLVVVAETGSFTRASDKLFVSPTAVMKQINSLEDHLGVKLLVRTSRGVELTAAGRSVCEDARTIFALSREATARARALAESEDRVFRVGTSMLNPSRVFMEIWQVVSDSMPGYTLRIVPFEDNRVGILSEVGAVGEKFDFLIGACDSNQWNALSNYVMLGTYAMCLAIPKGHPLARKKLVELDDLAGETVLMGRAGDSISVDRVRETLMENPRIRIEDVDNFYDIETFNKCEQERKLLLTLECWSEVHPSLATVRVNWEHSAPWGLIWPLKPSPAVARAVELVKELKDKGKLP